MTVKVGPTKVAVAQGSQILTIRQEGDAWTATPDHDSHDALSIRFANKGTITLQIYARCEGAESLNEQLSCGHSARLIVLTPPHNVIRITLELAGFNSSGDAEAGSAVFVLPVPNAPRAYSDAVARMLLRERNDTPVRYGRTFEFRTEPIRQGHQPLPVSSGRLIAPLRGAYRI